MDDIQRILSSSNFYEILNLDPKNFTAQDVQKRYKVLAMKVHPDKNKDPSATTAFAKLCQIKDILCDDRKRQDYNHSLSSKGMPIRRTQSAPVFHPSHHNYPYKSTPSKKGNGILFPLLTIFICAIGILHISNVEPTSNTISKESLSKIIMFDDHLTDHSLDYHFTSRYHKKVFFIPREWALINIFGSRNDLESNRIIEELSLKADEIYLERLQYQCELEKKNSFSRPSCVELDSIR